jgi:hypothetical protein
MTRKRKAPFVYGDDIEYINVVAVDNCVELRFCGKFACVYKTDLSYFLKYIRTSRGKTINN